MSTDAELINTAKEKFENFKQERTEEKRIEALNTLKDLKKVITHKELKQAIELAKMEKELLDEA